MDLIAKLDLEKAQLQRSKASSPTSIAAKSVSPGISLYKAFGQDKDSTIVAELQNQLEQEKAQRQQVHNTPRLHLLVLACVPTPCDCNQYSWTLYGLPL